MTMPGAAGKFAAAKQNVAVATRFRNHHSVQELPLRSGTATLFRNRHLFRSRHFVWKALQCRGGS
jgi:hypothetical protein